MEAAKLCDQWLTKLAAEGRSAHTLKAYAKDLKQFRVFVGGTGADLSQVDANLVQQFVAKRLEQDALALSSVQRELSSVRQFYEYLIELKRIDFNPISAHKFKRPARALPQIMDPVSLHRLLDVPKPADLSETKSVLWDRDSAVFELIYGSGLRAQELSGLNLNNLNLNSKQLTVLGKGSKERQLPLSGQSVTALTTWLGVRPKLIKAAAEPAVFVGSRGTRLTTRSIGRLIKQRAAVAGVDQEVYPHLLRHCFASHMLGATKDLRAVQQLLGHANVSTTQIYTQVDFEALCQVYDSSHPRSK